MTNLLLILINGKGQTWKEEPEDCFAATTKNEDSKSHWYEKTDILHMHSLMCKNYLPQQQLPASQVSKSYTVQNSTATLSFFHTCSFRKQEHSAVQVFLIWFCP